MSKRDVKWVQSAEQVENGKAFFEERGFDVDHFLSLLHMFKIGQMMTTDFNRLAAQHGLSIADFHLLGVLMMRSPEQMRVTDAAIALNVSNAALSARIRKLAALQLVTCAEANEDKRVKLLRLTLKGAAKVDDVGRSLESEGGFLKRYRQLPPSDREALDRILSDLHALMERDYIPVKRGDS